MLVMVMRPVSCRQVWGNASDAIAVVRPMLRRSYDPLCTGVDVGALAPQEADEGEPEAPGEVDRQAAGRRHRAQDGDAGGHALLGELEAGPPADEDDAPGQLRRATAQQRPPDQLVQGVVAADVLAERQ